MSALPLHRSRPADTPRADIVTASDLVRRFGLWQARAVQAPVFILFRGRPRLVLTSIEVMEALLAPHLPMGEMQCPDTTALLDLISDRLVITDQDLRITAASHTARGYFGTAVTPGVPVDGVAPAPLRTRFRRTLQHVQSSGVTQTLDFPVPDGSKSPLVVTIQPYQRGIALLWQDTATINATD